MQPCTHAAMQPKSGDVPGPSSGVAKPTDHENPKSNELGDAQEAPMTAPTTIDNAFDPSGSVTKHADLEDVEPTVLLNRLPYTRHVE